MQPYLDKRKCPVQESHCQAIRACPTGAVYYVADEREKIGGRIEFNLEQCTECGECAAKCCGDAISMR
jgi:formate hydrogenlyase subunit 6/NADH:ubiquinone oxidoreductase subunit I